MSRDTAPSAPASPPAFVLVPRTARPAHELRAAHLWVVTATGRRMPVDCSVAGGRAPLPLPMPLPRAGDDAAITLARSIESTLKSFAISAAVAYRAGDREQADLFATAGAS